MGVIDFCRRHRETRKFRREMDLTEAEIVAVLKPLARLHTAPVFFMALSRVMKDSINCASVQGDLGDSDRDHIITQMTQLTRGLIDELRSK